MIIEALLTLLYNVFALLTSPISIPQLPDTISQVMTDALEWVTVGLQIMGAYTHESYLLTLFGIVVAVDVGVMLYKFVMWVLKKIPMLGIK